MLFDYVFAGLASGSSMMVNSFGLNQHEMNSGMTSMPPSASNMMTLSFPSFQNPSLKFNASGSPLCE